MTDKELNIRKTVLKYLEMEIKKAQHSGKPYPLLITCQAIDNIYVVKEALEKQIPNKPRKAMSYGTFYCPCCKEQIVWSNNYCPSCGQSIDWSE